MPAHRPWTAEQDDALIAGYRRGDTLAELAEQMGCEIFHVVDHLAALRRRGVELPPRKPRWTPARRARLAKRKRKGHTLRELEAEFEITRGTLTSQLRTLRRLGYDLGDGTSPKRSA